MRRVVAAIAGALTVLLPVVPSVRADSAADGRPTARAHHQTVIRLAPVATAGAVVTLHGTAGRFRTVQLQQLTQGDWQPVARLRVRHGRYRTTLSGSTEPRWFRTVRAGRTSRIRTVDPLPNTTTTEPTAGATTGATGTTIGPAGPQDACGDRPQRADGSYWSCTFDDEFDGTALDRSKWVPQTIFATGDLLGVHACYDDDPSVVSVGGGTLDLSVRQASTALPCATGALPTPYRAGMVSTYHLFSQRYGRFEARLATTASSSPGLQESWWLWPDDRDPLAQLTWPFNGEIDIAEDYSQYPALGVPFLHYTANDNGGPVPGVNTAWDCTAPRGVFNTYTLTWTATRLEVDINGRTCLVNTSGDPAFQKRYILNLTQALGVGTNALVAGTPVPATTRVDYVRVWQ